MICENYKMTYKLFLLTLLFAFTAFSQEINKPSPFDHFTQFEVSIPLQGNKNRGEVYHDGRSNNSWFLPDGINANFGYGLHYKQWLGLSVNSGIGMKLSEKLVVAPVFANFRIMPKIADETRLGIDVGYGQSFALGRGNLNGDFKRIKLNLESDELQFFIEVLSYGIRLNNNSQGSISIGVALVSF